MNSPHTASLFNALRALSQIVDIHSRSLFKNTGVTAPQLSILVGPGGSIAPARVGAVQAGASKHRHHQRHKLRGWKKTA